MKERSPRKENTEERNRLLTVKNLTLKFIILKTTNSLFFIFFLLISIAFPYDACSQEEISETHALKITARAYDGGIKLRWAPTSMYAWKESNKSGYVIERITFKRNNEILPLEERKKSKILTPTPLKPLENGEDWKPLMERNPNAAIAAQALYGKTFSVEGQSLGLAARKDEQDNRFSFGLFAADQSLEVAEALGLYLDDQSAVKGEHYIYRVYPATKPKEMQIDTGFIYLSPDEIFQLPKIPEVVGEFTEKFSYISWNKIDVERFYTSYVVERSTDGTNFTKVNAMPFVGMDKNQQPTDRMLLRDSLEQTDQLYIYRVSGRTIFEELGPPSDLVQGIGLNAKVMSPNIEDISNILNKALSISWNFESEDEKEIQGFEMRRSATDAGIYKVISGDDLLDKESRTFIDEDPLPVNYYKIVALDKYSREITSFSVLAQLDDETPPAIPTGLRGTVMEDGEMLVTWTPNTEADLKGYRVYLANRKDRAEYVQLTAAPVRTNYFTYIVPMNTLSEEIFVKIRAEDYRQNKSELSEIVTIARPDSIPPAAPVFISALPTSKFINVVWENSASADVVQILLERKSSTEQEWKTITTLNFPEDLNKKTFPDSTVERGLTYEYRLKAIDDAELYTYSRIITGSKIDNGIRMPIEDMQLEIDRKRKLIAVNWQYEPDGKKLSHFVIYRSLGKERLRKYDTISKNDAQINMQTWKYLDKSLRMDNRYQYQIRAMYTDGAQSPLSKTFSVNY